MARRAFPSRRSTRGVYRAPWFYASSVNRRKDYRPTTIPGVDSREVVASAAMASGGINSAVAHNATGWVGSPNVGGGGLSTAQKVAIYTPTIYSDVFTGSDGVSLANWTCTAANSATAPIYNTNRGAFTIASVSDSQSRAIYVNQVPSDTYEALVDFTWSTITPNVVAEVWIRASGNWTNLFGTGPATGYGFSLQPSGVPSVLSTDSITAPVSQAFTSIGALSASTVYRLRGQVNPITSTSVLMRVKAWDASGSEPVAWSGEFTFTGLAATTANYIQLDADRFSGGPATIYMDNLTVTRRIPLNGATGNQGTTVAKKVLPGVAFAANGTAPTGAAKKVTVGVLRSALGVPVAVAGKKVSTPVLNGGLGSGPVVAGKKVSTPLALAGIGLAGRVAVVKKGIAAVISGVGQALLGTPRKVAPATGLATGETTPLATAKKSVVAALREALGTTGLLAATKVSTPSASGSIGNSERVSATKKSVVSALERAGYAVLAAAVKRGVTSGLGAIGNGPVGVVRKVRAATGSETLGNVGLASAKKVGKAQGIGSVGPTYIGIGSHLGSIVYAASALASGLHQALAKKAALATSRETTGAVAVGTAKKVNTPTATAGPGNSTTSLASKVANAVSAGTFGLAPRVLTVTVAQVAVAAANVFGAVTTALASKIAVLGTYTLSDLDIGDGTLAGSGRTRGITGQAQNVTARKSGTVTATGTTGAAPIGIGSHLGSIVYAAAALASGIQDVFAQKRSTPTITLANGETAAVQATKVSAVTGRESLGNASVAITLKRIATTGLAAVGHASNASTTAVATIMAVVDNFFGVTPFASAVKVATDTARTSTGQVGRSLVVKLNSVTGRGGVGTTGTASIRKSVTAAATEAFSVALTALAKKITTLTTTQFGDDYFGEGTFGYTGRTRTHGGGTASVTGKKIIPTTAQGAVGSAPMGLIVAVGQVYVAAQSYAVAFASAAAKKIVPTIAQGEAGTTETVTVKKRTIATAVQVFGNAPDAMLITIATVAATVKGFFGVTQQALATKLINVDDRLNVGGNATATGQKVTPATVRQTVGQSTRVSTVVRAVAVAQALFGTVHSVLTSKISTHTVDVQAPISENAQMSKTSIQTDIRTELAATPLGTTRKRTNIEALGAVGETVRTVVAKRLPAAVTAATGSSATVDTIKRARTVVRAAVAAYQTATAQKVTSASAIGATGVATPTLVQKVATPIQALANGISHFAYVLFIGIFYGADYLVETTDPFTPWVFGPLETNWTLELSVAAWDIPTDVLTEYDFTEVGTGWLMSEVFNT